MSANTVQRRTKSLWESCRTVRCQHGPVDGLKRQWVLSNMGGLGWIPMELKSPKEMAGMRPGAKL